MTIQLAKIEMQIPFRPEGYYDDVISRGEIVADRLVLEAKAYAELLEKYRSVSPWPLTPFGLVARSLRLLRTEADTGVGDTLARVVGPVGGTAYKQWFRATFGRSCGCTERQEALNIRFPYSLENPANDKGDQTKEADDGKGAVNPSGFDADASATDEGQD